MKHIISVFVLIVMTTILVKFLSQTNSFFYVLNQYYLFGVKMPKEYNGEWREWDKEYKLTKRVNYNGGVLNGSCEIIMGDFIHCKYNFKNGLAEGAQEVSLVKENKVITWEFKDGYPNELIHTTLGNGSSKPFIIENNVFKDQPSPSQAIGYFEIGFKEVDFDLNDWFSKAYERFYYSVR